MTATEVRADGLLDLAEMHRFGHDVSRVLLGYFTGIDPAVYRIHWDRMVDLITEENDIRTGKWDDTAPLSRIRDPYARSVAAVEMADEVHKAAVEQALSCVMVATRHAMQRHLEVPAL